MAPTPPKRRTPLVRRAVDAGVAAELGHGREPRLTRALAWVEGDQDGQGQWIKRYAYNGRTWVDFEHQGQPSKWVTLRACTVLRRLRVSLLQPGTDFSCSDPPGRVGR